MIAALLIAATITPCPQPKPISCTRAKEIVAERCPPQAASKSCPPGSTCLDKGCNQCQSCTLECPSLPTCPPPEPPETVHETKYIDVYLPTQPLAPVGHWLAGGGAVYHNGLGVTAQGGYEFTNGLVLLGGPLYIPQDAGDPVNGEVQSCNDKGKHCRVVPFTAASPAKSALGAQVLLLYSFR